MVPTERVSLGTMTDPKPAPKYIISSISQFQREKSPPPLPKIKIVVHEETQTIFTPPKLVIQDRTAEFNLKPRSAAPSPMQTTDKVFSFKYEGSGQTSNKNSGPSSPVVDKLQQRVKIYEDMNIKLRQEIEDLKNKQYGLYSKLNEKSFESAGQNHAQIELLKKDVAHLKVINERLRADAEKLKEKASSEVQVKMVEVSYQESILKELAKLRSEALASDFENQNLKKENVDLQRSILGLSMTSERPQSSVSTMTEFHSHDMINLPLPEKKKQVKFNLGEEGLRQTGSMKERISRRY